MEGYKTVKELEPKLRELYDWFNSNYTGVFRRDFQSGVSNSEPKIVFVQKLWEKLRLIDEKPSGYYSGEKIKLPRKRD